jgi:hypothetical protein
MLLLLTVSLLYIQTTHAQIEAGHSNYGFNIRAFNSYTGDNLIPTEYSPDIEGTAYLFPDYNRADIILVNGMPLNNLRVRFNLEKNQLYFSDSLTGSFVFNKAVLRKVVFKSVFANTGAPFVLKSGYPSINKQDTNYLYELQAGGKIDLLRNQERVIQTTKNEMTGDIKKEFVEYISYYIYCNKTIKEFRNNKPVLLEFMKDKQKEVDAYIATNKVNFKKNADVVKLVSYYNGL